VNDDPRCSTCGGRCLWADDAWTCTRCGDEWDRDHDPINFADPGEPVPCRRLLPYTVHEARSAGGRRCGRRAVDRGEDGEPRCAVHRGVDRRTETNRRTIRARERILGPRRR
jgi:hypothetical protein